MLCIVVLAIVKDKRRKKERRLKLNELVLLLLIFFFLLDFLNVFISYFFPGVVVFVGVDENGDVLPLLVFPVCAESGSGQHVILFGPVDVEDNGGIKCDFPVVFEPELHLNVE